MGQLSMTFSIDEKTIYTSLYNKDVDENKAAVAILEMLAVEVAILIVKANGNMPDKS